MHVLYLLLKALKNITEKKKKGTPLMTCLSKSFPDEGFTTSDNQKVDCAVEKHNWRIK